MVERITKVVNGKRFELEGEELEKFLIQREKDRIRDEEREKMRDKREDINLLDALAMQVKFIAANSELEMIPTLSARIAYEEEKMNKSFDISKIKKVKNKAEKDIERIKAELEQQLDEVKQMAKNAKESNDKIALVLVELNSALEAIKGFMMILPDLNKNVLAIKADIEDNQDSTVSTNIIGGKHGSFK